MGRFNRKPRWTPRVEGLEGRALLTTVTFLPNAPIAGTGFFTGPIAGVVEPNSEAQDFTATIDWGDGEKTTGTVLPQTPGNYVVYATKEYANLGTFTVTVTVTSAGDPPASAQGNLTVANRAPTIGEQQPRTAHEGDMVVIDFAQGSSDPDATQTLTYSLGPDAPALASIDAATGRFQWRATGDSSSTLFQDFSVTVTATDSGTPAMTASRTVAISVHAVAPTVSLGASSASVTQAGTFTRAGNIVDPGGGPWTATVDYGDGSGRQALPLSGSAFSLNHVYNTLGSYTANVEVTDRNGLKGSASVLVNVAAATSPPPTQPTPLVRIMGLAANRQKRKLTGFTLTFDAPLDAATANNPANYSIVAAGRDKRFGTRDDVVSTRFRSAILSADGRTLSLVTVKKVAPAKPLQFRAFNLLDRFGRLVDGDRNGTPGGTVVASVRKAGAPVLL